MTARECLVRAFRNMQALATGTEAEEEQLVAWLDKESGYSAVVEALLRARKRMMQYGESTAEIDKIDAALAKTRGPQAARGEVEKPAACNNVLCQLAGLHVSGCRFASGQPRLKKP